jgi:hypothetical protein
MSVFCPTNLAARTREKEVPQKATAQFFIVVDCPQFSLRPQKWVVVVVVVAEEKSFNFNAAELCTLARRLQKVLLVGQ